MHHKGDFTGRSNGCRAWPANRLIYVQDVKDRRELIMQKAKEQAVHKSREGIEVVDNKEAGVATADVLRTEVRNERR
jgi:hypothetical protein